MLRDHFLALTEETVDALKSKKRRDQLPFDAPEGSYVRSDYTAWRAVIMTAFKSAQASDVSPSELAKVFRSFEARLQNPNVAKAPLIGGDEDFYVGFFETTNNAGSVAYYPTHGFIGQVAKHLEAWNFIASARSVAKARNLRLVNFSDAVREVKDRADRLGINLDDESALDTILDAPIAGEAE